MTDAVCRVPVATVWSAPDRVRPVDQFAVQTDPDVDAWVAGMAPADRVDLQGRTETQLVLGEPVSVVGIDADWSQIVVPGQSSSKSAAGYPGWVPSAHLSSPVGEGGFLGSCGRTESGASGEGSVPGRAVSGDAVVGEAVVGEAVVVRVPRAVAYDDAGRVGGWLTIGTTLRVAAARDGRLLLRPGDRWIDGDDAQRVGVPAVSTLSALSVAAALLGSPYVWGGCGDGGIDCSGLVLIAHRVLGRPVPRDAHDQLAAVDVVPLGQRQRGDVLFFARGGRPAQHVGFDAGDGRLLHATMGGGRGTVECVPMPVERADTLVSAGRFLPAP